MTIVSGLSVSQWMAATNVSEANATYHRNGDQNSGGSTASTSAGDTVTISDQARQMLQAQPTAPSDGEAGQNGSFDQKGSSDQGLPSGTSASEEATGGMSTPSTSDQIDKIEKKIEKLGQEISELQTKAASDPTAKAQLDTKLDELAQLQEQLAELKQLLG